MGWRDDYKVHPAADVFPMMPDEDLHKLGEDIKTNGLKHPLIFEAPEEGEEAPLKDTLLDGRNRLAAMELVGIEVRGFDKHYYKGDPVAHIIGLNIHRRHLTKQEQADLIVVAIKAGKASRQVGEVPRHVKGKAGSEKDAAKAKAVETAKEYGISKRVVERSIAKAEGRTPKRRTNVRSITRHREGLCEPRTDAEIERDKFLTSIPDPSDAALALLTTEEREEAITRLQKLVDRLRPIAKLKAI